jgi:putative peptidoglycan lipid II flippase
MFRFLQKESKSIIGAATVVGILSFASRLVGLVRDRILAGEFGAGDTLDIYYAAFKIPDFLFSLIVVGALSASFIPIFTKYFGSAEKKKLAWAFTNNALHLIGLIMFLVSVLLFVLAGPLSEIIAPGFSAVKQLRVAEFTRVMLVAQVLLSFSMIFGSVLQSLKRFLLYALAPIFYNIGIIVGAVFFVDWFGLIGLAWGVVFGALLHLLVQIFGMTGTGYKYKWMMKWDDKDTREVIRLTGPRMLGIAVNQVLFIVLTIVATTLAAGSVTVFQFAFNIQFFPIGIIAVSYAIAAFPSFSEHFAKGEEDEFKQVFSSTVRQILFLMAPMSILFLILRAQIVRVVVGAGAFDWTATLLAADTLAFFALTFIPQALVYVLARAFFARHDTVTPLTAGIVSALIGIISAFLFTKSFGVIGLGAAYALSVTVNAAMLWVFLRQKLGTLHEMKILNSLFKIVAAGIVAAVVMQVLKPVVVNFFSLETFFGVFFQGLISGGLGLVAYVVVSHLLKSDELRIFISSVTRKQLRKVKQKESLPRGDGSGSV